MIFLCFILVFNCFFYVSGGGQVSDVDIYREIHILLNQAEPSNINRRR